MPISRNAMAEKIKKHATDALGVARSKANQAASAINEVITEKTDTALLATGKALKSRTSHRRVRSVIGKAGEVVHAIAENAIPLKGRVAIRLLGKPGETVSKQIGKLALATKKASVNKLSSAATAGMKKAGDHLLEKHKERRLERTPSKKK